MSRVFINPDAVDQVAATLRDVAADLERHAPRITGLLNEAGRSSRAAQDARRTAELYGSLSEDLRKLAELVREADAQGAPQPVIDLLIGRPWNDVRAVLSSQDPAQVFNWWRRLSSQQQAWLKKHQRDAIAGLDGIPVDVRDELNRQRVTARLWQLYAERAPLMCAVTPGERARLEKMQALIASHEAMLAPDLTVLLYDPSGDGQAAVAIGTVTTAAHIGVLVPGITNQLNNYPGIIGTARALDAEAKRQGSTDHAVIAWLGYDTPERNLTPAGKERAQQGAHALMPFIGGLRAVNTRGADVTVMGHSYGSLVTGMAAEDGMKADRIVLVGSPGTNAENVEELGMASADVYVARVPDDPIRHVFKSGEAKNYLVGGPVGVIAGKVARYDHDVHGPDPSLPEFGATPLPYDDKSHGHSGYYREKSLSLKNHGRVMLGRPPWK